MLKHIIVALLLIAVVLSVSGCCCCCSGSGYEDDYWDSYYSTIDTSETCEGVGCGGQYVANCAENCP